MGLRFSNGLLRLVRMFGLWGRDIQCQRVNAPFLHVISQGLIDCAVAGNGGHSLESLADNFHMEMGFPCGAASGVSGVFG